MIMLCQPHFWSRPYMCPGRATLKVTILRSFVVTTPTLAMVTSAAFKASYIWLLETATRRQNFRISLKLPELKSRFDYYFISFAFNIASSFMQQNYVLCWCWDGV